MCEPVCNVSILQDSSGRSQKPVSVQLKSGSTAIICVRKMTFDEPDVKVSTKRPYPTEIDVDDSKRLKTEKTPEAEHIVNHVKEIKRLNDLLSKRDEEIASLHKIVAALTRKQGL